MGYAHSLLDDAKALVIAPAYWDRRDWLIAGGAVGLVAASSSFDRQIKEESQENRSHQLDKTTKTVQRFGAEYSFVVLAGFGGYGYAFNDSRAKMVTTEGVTASILSAGVIAPLLKTIVGRVRPNASDRTFDFKPFSGNNSFPSGHATQAFAIASVITAHYDAWWVQVMAYGVAGAVGYSRIEQDAHYASDVVAGALIGGFVGKAIAKRHTSSSPTSAVIAPYFDGRITGLSFQKQF